MTRTTDTIGRIARRTTALALPLLVAATGTAAAHTGSGSGMMGGWGLFGGTMGFVGLLWMGLLLGVPLFLVYAYFDRRSDERDERPLAVLRERYARGELSDDEFERRREELQRTR
ncbi:SHOCT domain-containing protein [Halobellus ordinarius]|uniref:SHOCT domain-containing protein n=1 Tax=Halobellus ordinarius TaxID=3075120 RepID=UPI00287FF45E|nr:SHOCT domain-containing protein [Halobellus sp. ZY16]